MVCISFLISGSSVSEITSEKNLVVVTEDQWEFQVKCMTADQNIHASELKVGTLLLASILPYTQEIQFHLQSLCRAVLTCFNYMLSRGQFENLTIFYL